jgi:2-dehydropantoate 2-reductase
MGLFEECAAIAAAQGFPLRLEFLERVRPMFTAPASSLTASMLRDIERGAPIEADHILGDLLNRGGVSRDAGSLLNIAFLHVKAYEARRARNQAETHKAA